MTSGIGFAADTGFASGFPANDAKLRDSDVPLNCRYDCRAAIAGQARFLDLSVYEQTNHAAVL